MAPIAREMAKAAAVSPAAGGMDAEVIVCGGGPSGLTAALVLARAGIRVSVLERAPEIFEDPRAATFHPPTLELYEPLGITAMLHERGIVAPVWQYRDRRDGLVASFDLGLLSEETRFPYRLQCEQHKLVRMLAERLAGEPTASLRHDAEVAAVSQDEHGIDVTLASGERLRARYLVGADGGRSVVRKSQDISFEGFTYDERFLVVTTSDDFGASGYSYTNYVSDPDEWAALFKVPGEGPPGLWRVVFPTAMEMPAEALLDREAAGQRLMRFLPRQTAYTVRHTNLYQVHQRVAGSFRKGRVLLAGDAAHVNNPLGGMGMNFGIHDAFSAGEKLIAVLRDGQKEASLDRHDRQRRHVATAFLQAMTIQNKKLLEERDPASRAANLDQLRKTALDPALARDFLMKTSMIEGFRVAAAIG